MKRSMVPMRYIPLVLYRFVLCKKRLVSDWHRRLRCHQRVATGSAAEVVTPLAERPASYESTLEELAAAVQSCQQISDGETFSDEDAPSKEDLQVCRTAHQVPSWLLGIPS